MRLVHGHAHAEHSDEAHEHGFGHRTVTLALGKRFASGLSLSFSAFLGQGNRSDANYTDFGGATFSSIGNAAENPLTVCV